MPLRHATLAASLLALVCASGLPGCGDDSESTPRDHADGGSEPSPDLGEEDPPDLGAELPTDGGHQDTTDGGVQASDGGCDAADAVAVDAADAGPLQDADTPPQPDAAQDAGPAPDTGPPLEVPEFSAEAGPIEVPPLPPELQSCAVILEQECREGTTWQCALFDVGSGTWAAQVPRMTEQAFVFDRYYDLYHQANGQSRDVLFTRPVPAGTPEAEWSQPEYFRKYGARGDSSGWTATALWGAAARYRATGTPADYERLLDKLEAATFLYEVTDVPGLLARSHWAMLPEGAPEPHGHWGEAIASWEVGDGSDGHFSFPIAERFHDRLPSYYLDEVVIDGVAYATTPRVQSDASRDMYVRGLPGMLLAYDLLGEGPREDRLRATLRQELPCTLARMKKGRITNLQSNVEILEALASYFAGANLQTEEGDLDFGALDTLIFYVLEQPHPLHPEAFDASCPDGPPMDVDPALDLDASDPTFLADLLMLGLREQRGGEVPVAFSMHVSMRAADTLFITQWALTAHYLTGDQRYLDFLAQMLAELPFERTMRTFGALALPKYCAPHFAPSLAYPSLYNVLARVDPQRFPRFWQMLSRVAVEEGRHKEMGQREDAFFGLLYARMVDEGTDPDAADYVAHFVELLGTYGMNADDPLEPDRNYPRNFVDPPHPAVPLEQIEPGDPEWRLCEEPTSLLGVEVPPPRIDGIPVRSVDPLPLRWRIGGTMLWQMDPWMVLREYGGVGMDEQWPMIGLFTPYWVGRADGTITEGEGLVLAWRALEEACE